MRDERDASREPSAANEAKPPSNDAPQAVGADDERRRQIARAVAPDRDDTANATAVAAAHLGDPQALPHLRTGIPCGLEEDLVEHATANRQAAVAKSPIPVASDEVPAQLLARRRAHDHSGEMGRSTCFDIGEHAHIVQNPRRLWAQILRTGLVAWKPLAIDDQHARAGAGERECGG